MPNRFGRAGPHHSHLSAWGCPPLLRETALCPEPDAHQPAGADGLALIRAPLPPPPPCSSWGSSDWSGAWGGVGTVSGWAAPSFRLFSLLSPQPTRPLLRRRRFLLSSTTCCRESPKSTRGAIPCCRSATTARNSLGEALSLRDAVASAFTMRSDFWAHGMIFDNCAPALVGKRGEGSVPPAWRAWAHTRKSGRACAEPCPSPCTPFPLSRTRSRGLSRRHRMFSVASFYSSEPSHGLSLITHAVLARPCAGAPRPSLDDLSVRARLEPTAGGGACPPFTDVGGPLFALADKRTCLVSPGHLQTGAP